MWKYVLWAMAQKSEFKVWQTEEGKKDKQCNEAKQNSIKSYNYWLIKGEKSTNETHKKMNKLKNKASKIISK